eukprot:GHVU01083618.1.p1 GENE.GHVU01083618.1~~GHVU01083618.1.p1  ORF type:complete len:191 (+),score=4.75 GHVU01083618.1:285-857(+)
MPLIHSLRSSSWLAMGCEAHWRASTPTDINDRDPPLPAPICLAAHMQLLKRMSSVCKDALFYASACSYIVGVARSDELRMPPTHTRGRSVEGAKALPALAPHTYVHTARTNHTCAHTQNAHVHITSPVPQNEVLPAVYGCGRRGYERNAFGRSATLLDSRIFPLGSSNMLRWCRVLPRRNDVTSETEKCK